MKRDICDTGHLFLKTPKWAESRDENMSWSEVEKVASGPFVRFGKGTNTIKLYIAGDPKVIRCRPQNNAPGFEQVGVLPVLNDEGKFQVLALRSRRLRDALLEQWEVIEGKVVDIKKTGDNFETQYEVKLSKSKKKPDAKKIAACDKAFSAFIKSNKETYPDVPE